MKVCLIGSSGFLAKSIIRFCLNFKIPLIIIGRKRPLLEIDFEFVQIDLLITEIPVHICLRADVIIYTAALGVQSSERIKSEDMLKVNTFIPITLTQRLKEQNYSGKFVSFGSYFEIGAINNFNKPFSEEDVIYSNGKITNEYGLSKRLFSKYIFDAELSFTYYHLILPTIYGQDENPNRLIPYLVNSILRNTTPKLSAGNQVRQYLLVDDAVSILFNILHSNIEKGIYNLPCAETITVREIAKIIFDTLNRPLNEEIFGKENRNDETMQVLELDSNKLIEKINVKRLSKLRDYLLNSN